jgi:hypothetical protein
VRGLVRYFSMFLSFLRLNLNAAQRLLFPRSRSAFQQLQREVDRLYRIVDHAKHGIHLQFQIDFLSQRGAEISQDPFGVVFLAVEAPVDESLDAPADGREQGRACQG